MIRAKQLPKPLVILSAKILNRLLKRKFRKLKINPVPVKPDHSILLLCNHFSYWDGFFGNYLAYFALHKQVPMKASFVMSVERQLELNPWLRWFGSFSVAPGKRRMKESLDYAAELLGTPGNVLLYFPQGNLESCHVREIVFQDGLNTLVPQIKGKCQIIWTSNIIEYFEGVRPSVEFNLLDCGTNETYDFDKLRGEVNAFHRRALAKQLRFTETGGEAV